VKPKFCSVLVFMLTSQFEAHGTSLISPVLALLRDPKYAPSVHLFLTIETDEDSSNNIRTTTQFQRPKWRNGLTTTGLTYRPNNWANSFRSHALGIWRLVDKCLPYLIRAICHCFVAVMKMQCDHHVRFICITTTVAAGQILRALSKSNICVALHICLI
jgi:hypothetical protein